MENINRFKLIRLIALVVFFLVLLPVNTSAQNQNTEQSPLDGIGVARPNSDEREVAINGEFIRFKLKVSDRILFVAVKYRISEEMLNGNASENTPLGKMLMSDEHRGCRSNPDEQI